MAVVIRQFQSRDVDLTTLVDRLALATDDIAYATGSVLDGLGDTESDIDVYVLTSPELLKQRASRFAEERRLQQIRRNFGIEYVDVAGREFDVEIHTKDKLLEMIEALAALDPFDSKQIETSFDSLGRFERSEAVEFLHRFHIAQPFYNCELFEHLAQAFPKRRFFQWNAAVLLIQVKDYGKGTRRSLKQGDYENAYLKLTRMYDALGDAHLFATGNSLDRWKWRLPKLRTTAPESFLRAYLDVQLNRMGSSRSLEEFVSEKLELTEEFITQIKELWQP